MKGKTILFREEQLDFIKEQSKMFNVHKFCRDKLNEYMELIKNVKKKSE